MANAERPQARATLQVDDDRVRITEWRFPPGSATGFHRHELDYVVVPMTTGELLLKTAEGENTSNLIAGQSYARKAGVEHDVINVNTYDFVFIEVEIKT